MNEKISKIELEKIMENKKAFDKLMMAYWISVPTDADKAPDEIVIKKITGDKIVYNKISNGVEYGMGITNKQELQKYIDKVKLVNDKNDSIFDMFDKTKEE
jgi:hypothetical protein